MEGGIQVRFCRICIYTSQILQVSTASIALEERPWPVRERPRHGNGGAATPVCVPWTRVLPEPWRRENKRGWVPPPILFHSPRLCRFQIPRFCKISFARFQFAVAPLRPATPFQVSSCLLTDSPSHAFPFQVVTHPSVSFRCAILCQSFPSISGLTRSANCDLL